MKTINNFLDNAPLWQVYIFAWFCTGLFTSSIFYGFQLIEAIDPSSSLMIFSVTNCIKMGATLGLMFGLMVMLMISMMRKSTIFWEYAREAEKLINDANSKEQLQAIFNNQFQELRKKCQGGPQIPELNRLYTIMKTKYDYV